MTRSGGRPGPVRVAREARDDVEMELAQDVAERAKIDFLRARVVFEETRRATPSGVGGCATAALADVSSDASGKSSIEISTRHEGQRRIR